MDKTWEILVDLRTKQEYVSAVEAVNTLDNLSEPIEELNDIQKKRLEEAKFAVMENLTR